MDLATGTPRDGEAVHTALDRLLARGRAVAEKLSATRTKAVDKVQKLVPTWASMVRQWWWDAWARVGSLGLSEELFALVLTVLIPAMYVSLIGARNHHDAATRAEFATVSERLCAQVRAHPAW